MYVPKEDVFSTVMSYLDANAMGSIFSGQNHVIHMDEPALGDRNIDNISANVCVRDKLWRVGGLVVAEDSHGCDVELKGSGNKLSKRNAYVISAGQGFSRCELKSGCQIA